MKTPHKKKYIFIGDAWPYVNGDLHIGHLAGHLLPADIFARFHRLIGNKVLMVSGSDCYGTPITVEADKRGMTPPEVVAQYHPQVEKLIKLYGFSYDLYTKTTTENHTRVVQDMFVKMAKNGYISKASTEQYYSPEENKFLPDRYVEGECPHCGYRDARGDQCDNCTRVLEAGELKNPRTKLGKTKVELKNTEHYFIEWEKLQTNFLEKYVESTSSNWRPWVEAETKGWLKKGLKKRAITRDLAWGVSIPVEELQKELGEDFIIDNVENKRIYVWFDAVIGYLSASQEWSAGTEKWRDWWYNPESEHCYFMGKDNLVFHTLFWPGQLWGAYGDEIKKPDVLPINHYLNLEGRKFSKSRGVIIDSEYIAQTYGVDPVRFYLTYIMPETSDANFTWEHFVEVNNSVLIGAIGNFINRTLVLVKQYGFSESSERVALIHGSIEQAFADMTDNLSRCEFKLYIHEIEALASSGNRYLAEQEPWKKDKTEEQRKTILGNSLLTVLALQLALQPIIPKTAQKLAEMIGVSFSEWPIESFVSFLTKELGKVKVTVTAPLFVKIDPLVIESEKAKLHL